MAAASGVYTRKASRAETAEVLPGAGLYTSRMASAACVAAMATTGLSEAAA
jgi:hypothetical protein